MLEFAYWAKVNFSRYDRYIHRRSPKADCRLTTQLQTLAFRLDSIN